MDKIKAFTSSSNKLDLQANFMKKMNETGFNKFISHIPLEAEILMKYTSKLWDSYTECENCKKCSSLIECKNKINGSYLKTVINGNAPTFIYQACKYYNKESYKNNVELFNVPKFVKEASIANIYTNDKKRVAIIREMKKFITNYDKDNFAKGFYLTGSFGSGKTYLIAALFNELAKKGTKSIIIHVPELIRNIKESFDTDYKERFDALKNVDLLLLDDIGAEYLTAYSRDEIIEPILQHRMDEKLPTFFTSNFNMKQLEAHLAVTSNGNDALKAKRIIERIKQLSIEIELISENLRS